MSKLFSPLFRIIDAIADDDFYLQAMAVDKELRGKGVGSTLMDDGKFSLTVMSTIFYLGVITFHLYC